MKDYDVLVVGGGAAGLSAALVPLRARRAVADPSGPLPGCVALDGSRPC